jgi:hypothetical protein
MPDMLNTTGGPVIRTGRARQSREIASLSKDKKPEHMVWQTPDDRDAELDKALRELGEDLLEREVPERLLRVLRSAREADKRRKRQKR